MIILYSFAVRYNNVSFNCWIAFMRLAGIGPISITNLVLSEHMVLCNVILFRECRCNGLRVYAVCVCTKVRLPGIGQSAHVIGGSRFTRPASNSRRTLLN